MKITGIKVYQVHFALFFDKLLPFSNFKLQWAPLNGITDNGINRIIESLLGTFSQSHQLENWLVHWKKEFGYWYHSLIGIRHGLAQSDPIMRRLLYLQY
jgi:hypothetical protein